MKKGKLTAGIVLLLIALVYLGAMIFLGAAHQFFFFLAFLGLGFALVDDAITESKDNA